MLEKILQDRVKEYRELKGLTQFDLSVRLTIKFGYNVSIDTIKNWECGRNPPKIQSMAKLNELLKKEGI